MSERQSHPFIEYLLGLMESDNGRAALAHLRRGVRRAPGEVREMLPHVVSFLPATRRDEERYFLIASLFGLFPCRGGEPMGAVFRRMSEGREDATQRRFEAMLVSPREDLFRFHLPSAVRLAKSMAVPVPIDYQRLFEDLARWDRPRRPVQLQWARQFWGPEPRGARSRQSDTMNTSRAE